MANLNECEHVFVHLETRREAKPNGRYSTLYQRQDEFFCQKCLESKTITKSESRSEDKPDWY